MATQLGGVAEAGTVRERMGHGSLAVTSGYMHEEASNRTLVVRNTGTQPVQVTILSGAPWDSAFSWNAVGPVWLDIGQALDVHIDFSPVHAGTHRGVLTVTSDTPGNPQRVSLRGKCKADRRVG